MAASMLNLVLGILASLQGAADSFWGELDGSRVATLVRDHSKVQSVTFGEGLSRRSPFGQGRGHLLVVRTDEGGWCVLECQFAARKRSGRVFPVVLLQRLAVVRPDGGIAVQRSEVEWFAGLQLECDLGQVVPAEFGGDLVLEGDDPANARIVARPDVDLWFIEKLTLPEPASTSEESGSGLQAFAGNYEMYTDGKHAGRLRLSVADNGVVRGSFVSAQTGEAYSVAGRFGGPEYRLRLRITFPQSVQDLELYFWRHMPGVGTGTLQSLDHVYGVLVARPGTVKFSAEAAR